MPTRPATADDVRRRLRPDELPRLEATVARHPDAVIRRAAATALRLLGVGAPAPQPPAPTAAAAAVPTPPAPTPAPPLEPLPYGARTVTPAEALRIAEQQTAAEEARWAEFTASTFGDDR